MNTIYKSLIALGVVLPGVAFADTLFDVGNTIGGLVDLVTPIVVALALVMFFWGLITYFTAKGDEKALEKARNTMIYGVIILFVMVSIWGIVNILQDTFNVGGTQTVTPPSVTR
ncbi:MAG: hypothetical protein RLZZ283_475 [Candidatus Parcubacteria bacterium]|jgi:hypothetical protein